jgi:hypothetical protein
MVDSADPGFYGAAWRFADFCQQLYAGSAYLQFVLKSCVDQFFTTEDTENAENVDFL